jgi:predicted transcriptional regulator
MSTVTLSVGSREDVGRRVLSAFAGEPQGARITFATEELLWRVITVKRLALLKIMTGAGPMSIREAARRAERDVKAVHRDIHAWLDAGILEKNERGRVVFPYSAVHVDFVLCAA